MPSLKRLVVVVAVALSAMLGAASVAGADVPADPRADAVPAALSSAEAAAQPPVFTPEPPPVRPEDPAPDGGLPWWLWVVLALLVGTGVSVSVALWRGSRPPPGYKPVLESTAELVAMGNRRSPGINSGGHR